MKKWAMPLAAAALIAVIAVAGATFALTDSEDEGGPRVSRDADGRGESAGDDSAADCVDPLCVDAGEGPAAICLEGAIDCDDTIEKPVDDVCIMIYPPPPECANPDEPVSNEPSLIDPPNPDGCDFANNVAACGKHAIALAIEDLASRIGSAEGITVKSIEFVEWPDACFGISKPGIACAEVITPGFKLVLRRNGWGDSFEYHSDLGSRVVLAEMIIYD